MNKDNLKNIYHSFNKKIKDKPFLLKINVLLVPLAKYFYFSTERKLRKGRDISQSNSNSVLFFTAHKCASTFLDDVFEKLGKPTNIVPVHFPNYFPDADEDNIFEDSKFLNAAFKDKGYYYGAFRKPHNVPHIEKYKVVIVLRDPRDILTSLYFSAAFNHPISRKVIIENRKKALSQTIDEFVIEHASNLNEDFKIYINNFLSLENSLFLKYEDMITDFDEWLPKIVNFIGWDNSKAVMEEIINTSSFTVKKEDKHSFVRNIKSGDHLNKLKPETIDKLNYIFGEVLMELDYKL